MIILIYNRGEIACRILRTCQKLGIQTVGIYTPEDQFSSHIKETDFKIELPPGDLSFNYLNVDFIIEKSLKLNVTAVHPGYGFVSESAEACLKFENAGIIWIGPSATNIVDFSSKHISKNIAKSCGVPITDYAIVESVESCLKESEIVGYPVILKLSSGGGGIGMYRCKNKSDVLKYFPLVELKTKSVFKDSKILIEKFLSNCHHIEIQIIGDGNGHVISLAELATIAYTGIVKKVFLVGYHDALKNDLDNNQILQQALNVLAGEVYHRLGLGLAPLAVALSTVTHVDMTIPS
ncbi:biotin carboxylase-like [Hydra vulgaris]|uniref:biotin carboxylase-like n=1 Tax=Hydra vulgaris TaxID=6087 RepID=UPI0032EA4477